MSTSDGQLIGWRKSSYNNETHNCVEVGSAAEVVGVRDTKDRDDGILVFSRGSWQRFAAKVKARAFG